VLVEVLRDHGDAVLVRPGELVGQVLRADGVLRARAVDDLARVAHLRVPRVLLRAAPHLARTAAAGSGERERGESGEEEGEAARHRDRG
jgi:hypothetical protein